MAPHNLQIVLASRPEGEIVLSQTFAPKTEPIPTASDLKEGEILVETLYVSVDPVMRKWIDESNDMIEIKIGDPMPGPALNRVVASKNPNYQPGDLVRAWTGWRQYAVISDFEAVQAEKTVIPAGARTSDALGFLGLTGLTGYIGMQHLAQVKKGETVVVSTAAGATGSIAAQTAKIAGARVVGITGSDDKVAWLKGELGLDEALNYKAPDFEDQFKKAVGEGIDLYFDNVGGRQLELAIDHAKPFSRIIICGQTTGYKDANKAGVRNIVKVAIGSITIKGLSIFAYRELFPAAREQLSQWAAEGKLKHSQTLLKGLEAAPQGLVDLLAGKNTGKMLVEVKKID